MTALIDCRWEVRDITPRSSVEVCSVEAVANFTHNHVTCGRLCQTPPNQ